MSQYLSPSPVGTTPVHARRTPALRVCTPVGTNADFIAELHSDYTVAQASGVVSWLHRAARRLLPTFGRRAKSAVVLVAIVLAVLLGNLSVLPRHHDPVGSASVVVAFPINCGPLKFACDAIDAAVSSIGTFIADGLRGIVDSAISPNSWCNRTTMAPERPDTGWSGSILAAARSKSQFFESYNTDAGTTWSRYGAAGTTWNTYFLDCLSAGNIANFAANAVFDFAKLVSVLAIVIFQQTFNSGLLNIFLGGDPPPVQQIIDSLNLQIYANLAALAIVIGALILAYRAILRGFGMADFLSKFLVMVAVSAFAVLFFQNAIPWIRWGNQQVNDITNSVMTALRGSECTNAEGKPIQLKPVDCTAESVYNTLVYTPWANGEVGSLSSTNGQGNTAGDKRKLAARILDQQAFTWADVKGVDTEIIGQRVKSTEGPITGARVDSGLIDKAKAKVADRDKMVKDDWGLVIRDDKDPNKVTPFNPEGTEGYSQAHPTKQSETVWSMWSGGKGGERFGIAVLAVVGAWAFGGMLIAIAFTYLVLQIATVLYALISPLAFLAGLVPVYGMRVFLAVAEGFIGSFVKRVAMAVFVALLLTLYQVILSAEGVPWWLQMVLILAIAGGGASYRKKLTSLSTLGFGGGGGGGGGLGSSAARASAMRNTWQGARDLAIIDRVAAATRAAVNPGSGGSGVRPGSAVNYGSRERILQRDQAAARNAIRHGRDPNYLPRAGSGPGGRTTGRYPVNSSGPGGPRALNAGPAGSNRGTISPYDARDADRAGRRLQGDVRDADRALSALEGASRRARGSYQGQEPSAGGSGSRRGSRPGSDGVPGMGRRGNE